MTILPKIEQLIQLKDLVVFFPRAPDFSWPSSKRQPHTFKPLSIPNLKCGMSSCLFRTFLLWRGFRAEGVDVPAFPAGLKVAVPVGCWQGCRQGCRQGWGCLPCLGKHSNRGQVLISWPPGPTLQTKNVLPCSRTSLGYRGRPSLLLLLPKHYVPLASYRSTLSALRCFLGSARQQVRIHVYR